MKRPKAVVNVMGGVVGRADGDNLDLDVEVHDYDIQDIDEDDPDRTFGKDDYGVYEVFLL